ncbi:alpha/beta-hydrolase [Cubamyces lactineus]|nr:alpha/beta-hydrolase [Cubamyces lactineus]
MAYTTTTIHHRFPSQRLQEDVVFVGKRYTPEGADAAGAATLLFFHCAGSHKEAWEPTIQQLFAKDAANGTEKRFIRQAWSFDMPNHGEAAQWNQDLLKRLDKPLTVEDYAEGLRHFIASGALPGHRLITIGHSLGATAMLLATLPDKLPPPPYETVVMVEPALISPECYKENFDVQDGLLKATSKGVLKRRDTWESREQAKEYFEKRFPWDTWDARVLELYVRHALRDVETPGGGTPKVTLCCEKAQESNAYSYISPHFRIVELFRSGMDPSLPVHWVTGERDDIAPDYVHESVMKLRKVASTCKVPDAGHFVVQENPDGLASALYSIVIGKAVPLASL